ncbi:maltokinase N-terminal cap-like domain-containing protein [Streptomyces sp. NBC_00370]|uniref:maltokinase N-terminal cap-like domain-containing protein n=1 Tax=Streptomyces sp. NBC_00370 TaxID=2975728 RepID=UPI002E263700
MSAPLPSASAVLRSAEVRRGLAAWLPEQRWFAGSGGTPAGLRVTGVHRFTHDSADASSAGAFVHAHVRGDGGADGTTYLLALGMTRGTVVPVGSSLVARVGALTVYDALSDAALVNALVRHIVEGHTMDGVSYRPEAHAGPAPRAGLPVRPLAAEQSNSSVIAGEQYILKLFRRPGPGPSADLTVHRLLRDAGSPHVTPLLGAVEDVATGATLATLQRFLPDAVDGWALAVEAARGADAVHTRFPAQMRDLGTAVAAVHRDLARAGGQVIMGPGHYRRMSEVFSQRLEHALEECPRLEPLAAPLRAAFASVAALRPAVPGVAHPIHGDLHLGQTLRTRTGWLLLDFEGEPLASPAQRTGRHSPLRDVAGMLRSFDYAAHHDPTERLTAVDGAQDDDTGALPWSRRLRREFLRGYTAGRPLQADLLTVLRACELDKAVYEVLYETRHRPHWTRIPLAALDRELTAAGR